MKQLELGQTVMTDSVQQIVLAKPALHEIIIRSLNRHRSGDWGDMPYEDKALNDRAMSSDPDLQGRIMSSYNLTADVKIWIITEQDRSVTTVLLPSDY